MLRHADWYLFKFSHNKIIIFLASQIACYNQNSIIYIGNKNTFVWFLWSMHVVDFDFAMVFME